MGTVHMCAGLCDDDRGHNTPAHTRYLKTGTREALLHPCTAPPQARLTAAVAPSSSSPDRRRVTIMSGTAGAPSPSRGSHGVRCRSPAGGKDAAAGVQSRRSTWLAIGRKWLFKVCPARTVERELQLVGVTLAERKLRLWDGHRHLCKPRGFRTCEQAGPVQTSTEWCRPRAPPPVVTLPHSPSGRYQTGDSAAPASPASSSATANVDC